MATNKQPDEGGTPAETKADDIARLSRKQAKSLALNPGLLLLAVVVITPALVTGLTLILGSQSAASDGIAFIISFLLLFLPLGVWFFLPGKILARSCQKVDINYPAKGNLQLTFLTASVIAIVAGLTAFFVALWIYLVMILWGSNNDTNIGIVIVIAGAALLLAALIFTITFSLLLPWIIRWKRTTANLFLIALALIISVVTLMPASDALMRETANRTREATLGSDCKYVKTYGGDNFKTIFDLPKQDAKQLEITRSTYCQTYAPNNLNIPNTQIYTIP